MDVNDPPAIAIEADVEVSAPADGGNGPDVAIRFHVTAQVDTLDQAILDLDFPVNATAAQNPNEPGSMLSNAHMDTYAGTYSISTGAGPVPMGGELPPPIAPSAMMASALTPPLGDTLPYGSAAPRPIEKVSGQIRAADVAAIRPHVASLQAMSNGDQRRAISDRSNGRLLVAIITRKGSIDSMWVDALSALPVREISRRSNGDFVKVRYEYERHGAAMLVQTLTETEVFTKSTENSLVVRRRLSNVKTR